MAEMTGWPTDGAEGSVSSEARWRKMAKLFAPSGVVTGFGGQLAPTLGAGVINVATGAAWVDGHYCELESPASESSTANGLLVVRFTPADNLFELVWRDGATVPTQTDAVWELPIAKLVAGVLTDLRQIIPIGGTGLRRLAQITLAAPGPVIDFKDIPQDLSDLRVVALLRADTAVVAQAGRLKFNPDTSAALWDNQQLRGTATTASAIYAAGGAGATITMPGASALAAYFAPITVDIPGYRHPTARRTALISNGWSRSTAGTIPSGDLFIDQGIGYWRAALAITQITLSPDSGNLAAGSTAALYGT